MREENKTRREIKTVFLFGVSVLFCYANQICFFIFLFRFRYIFFLLLVFFSSSVFAIFITSNRLSLVSISEYISFSRRAKETFE